jgi:hypothetical protein
MSETLGGCVIHVRPSTRKRPAIAVGRFAHEQQSIPIVKDGAAHVDLRRGVAAFSGKQRFDALDWRCCMSRHYPGRQRPQHLVAFAVVWLAHEWQSRLSDCLKLARPDQPVRLLHRHISSST